MKKSSLCPFFLIVLLILGTSRIAMANRFVLDTTGGGGGQNEYTVTDTATGIMWLYDANQIYGGWNGGQSFTENMDWAGYQDWRTPKIEEYETLFEAIGNPTVFPTQLYPPFNDIMQFYWTDSENIVFNTEDNTTFYDYDNPNWIWPVRTAQQPVPEPTTIFLLGSGLALISGLWKRLRLC